MVDASQIGQTDKGPIMDPKNDEQTELLRAIWQQLVTVDKTLNTKIDALDKSLSGRIDALGSRVDAVDKSLSARIDETNATLRAFMHQTHENFARVHRNFEKVNLRLEHLELGNPLH